MKKNFKKMMAMGVMLIAPVAVMTIAQPNMAHADSYWQAASGNTSHKYDKAVNDPNSEINKGNAQGLKEYKNWSKGEQQYSNQMAKEAKQHHMSTNDWVNEQTAKSNAKQEKDAANAHGDDVHNAPFDNSNDAPSKAFKENTKKAQQQAKRANVRPKKQTTKHTKQVANKRQQAQKATKARKTLRQKRVAIVKKLQKQVAKINRQLKNKKLTKKHRASLNHHKRNVTKQLRNEQRLLKTKTMTKKQRTNKQKAALKRVNKALKNKKLTKQHRASLKQQANSLRRMLHQK